MNSNNCSLTSFVPLKPYPAIVAPPEYGHFCPGFDPEYFQKLAALDGEHPIAFYASIVMDYLMKPNRDLVDFVDRIRRETGFVANRTLAVHVRHGARLLLRTSPTTWRLAAAAAR